MLDLLREKSPNSPTSGVGSAETPEVFPWAVSAIPELDIWLSRSFCAFSLPRAVP